MYRYLAVRHCKLQRWWVVGCTSLPFLASVTSCVRLTSGGGRFCKSLLSAEQPCCWRRCWYPERCVLAHGGCSRRTSSRSLLTTGTNGFASSTLSHRRTRAVRCTSAPSARLPMFSIVAAARSTYAALTERLRLRAGGIGATQPK